MKGQPIRKQEISLSSEEKVMASQPAYLSLHQHVSVLPLRRKSLLPVTGGRLRAGHLFGAIRCLGSPIASVPPELLPLLPFAPAPCTGMVALAALPLSWISATALLQGQTFQNRLHCTFPTPTFQKAGGHLCRFLSSHLMGHSPSGLQWT